MNDLLSRTLVQVEIGESVSHDPLHLFPLVDGTTFAEEGVTLLEEALEGGTLRVEEIDERGSVPELRVTYGASVPVLILEGDELIGAPWKFGPLPLYTKRPSSLVTESTT